MDFKVKDSVIPRWKPTLYRMNKPVAHLILSRVGLTYKTHNKSSVESFFLDCLGLTQF
jgi:hypothetical protein